MYSPQESQPGIRHCDAVVIRCIARGDDPLIHSRNITPPHIFMLAHEEKLAWVLVAHAQI